MNVRARDPRDIYQRSLGAPAPKMGADAKPKPRRRITRSSRPNLGIEQEYRQRLERMVAEMAASILFRVKAAYRANEPATIKLALDDGVDDVAALSILSKLCSPSPCLPRQRLPRQTASRYPTASHYEPHLGALAFDRKTASEHLSEAIKKLSLRWQRKFDEAAPKLARWFATTASKRSDATLQRILKDGGFTVRFTMTPAAADIIDAAIAENVALIRSIPQQYLTQVEGAVMRSVRQGRDLGPLAKELRKQYGVTKRRAALIARDQNNKATADMTRARQVEKGYRAIWRHSHAGKTPRPTHVANDGKVYDPAKGWYDPHEKKRIWPGTLINCRCFSQTIIPGFEP